MKPKTPRSKPVAEIADHPATVLEVMPHDLAREETSALRRISPWRSRWPELAEFDRKVTGLDQRRQRVTEELHKLTQERTLAPEHDARRLAEWIAAGEKGKKPEPTVPELDRRIEEAERERDALARAADNALEEKERYVEKHRKRLVRGKEKETAELRERIEQLVGELASTRAELVETRHDAVWAALYPNRAAGAGPPTTIAGGQLRVLERAHLATQVSPEQVFDLLRADAQFLAAALTAEQREAMGIKRDDAAVWSSTPEGIEAERREKREALKRYRDLWGTEPA